MARNLQVLLTETVTGTGIVGDVVNVRKGFARNFLLPRGFATTPDEGKVAELKTRRKDAIKQLGVQRKHREEMIAKMEGTELTLVRSCNDLGILYAAVTQQELADELAKVGFKGILDREVRLGQPIKRVGDYPVSVKFQMPSVPDADDKGGKGIEAVSLEAEVKVHVKADRELEMDRRRAEEEAAAAAHAQQQADKGGAGGEDGQRREKNKGATFATEKPKAKDEEAPAKQAGKGGSGVKKAEPKAEKAEKSDKGAKKK